jgi:putative peptidoglycan lipid II flippase
VGRTALALAPLVVAARGVAFLVPILVASRYGASGTSDAWFAALAVPTVLLVVVSNAMGVAATPALATTAWRDPGRLRSHAGTLAAIAGGITAVCDLVGCGSAPFLLPRLTRFDADTRSLATWFLLSLAPWSAIAASIAVFRSAVEIRGRFAVSGLAPLARGATTLLILGLGASSPSRLPLAWTLGAGVEACLLLAALGSSSARRPGAIGSLGLGGVIPLVLGEGMVALNLVVDKAFAAGLAPGTVTVVEYADRTRLIPQTLMEGTLLAVAYATWSNTWARGERATFASQLDRSLRQVASLSGPGLAALHLARIPVCTLLYAHGQFTGSNAESSAAVLAFLLPGLWTMMLGTLAMRAHVVIGRLRPVLWLGGLSVAANTALDAVLVRPLGAPGLALASSVVWILVPIGYLASLRDVLAGGFDPAAWRRTAIFGGGAILAALLCELGGAPTSWADPRLVAGLATECVLAALALRSFR